MNTWATTARAVMAKTLLDCQAASMTPEATAKAIDAAYPFGDRSHHPYKVWLRERKEFFSRHGLPRNGDHKTQRERVGDLVAQMSAKRHWA